MSAAVLAVIVPLAALIAGIGGALVNALLQRRNASGKVSTSEASVLWEQSQALIKLLGADRDKAEARVARLMDSQAGHAAPALEALNKSMAAVLEAMQRQNVLMTEVRQLLRRLDRKETHVADPGKPG